MNEHIGTLIFFSIIYFPVLLGYVGMYRHTNKQWEALVTEGKLTEAGLLNKKRKTLMLALKVVLWVFAFCAILSALIIWLV
jgi:hypothetical protein